MFGAKTTRMLSVLERCSYQNRKVIAFKPKLDDRYAEGEICTHAGLKFPAVNVTSGKEILEKCKGYDVVGVDEAFMIDNCANALIALYTHGITVVVSSIQMSASGNVFKEIKEILPWATKIDVCPAVCVKSGNNAYYTVRKVENLSEIEVGGAEMYEPRAWSKTPFMNAFYDENND
jgi:thymidine kinase